jgi:hypothetical protein
MSDFDSTGSDDTGYDTADFDGDDRLRALLRGGDPAGSLTPAAPAALESLLEDVMSADLEIRPADPGSDGRPRRTRATWLVAAAAVAAIAAGGAFAVTGLSGDDAGAPQADQPARTTPQGNTGIAGQTTRLRAGTPQDRCQAPTPELLAQYDQAFEGTVTSVAGGTITFQTTDVYHGQVGSTVELDSPPAGVAKMLTGGATTYQVGQTYVVSAYQGAVSMCGYSGLASSPLQQIYKEAFVH